MDYELLAKIAYCSVAFGFLVAHHKSMVSGEEWGAAVRLTSFALSAAAASVWPLFFLARCGASIVSFGGMSK